MDINFFGKDNQGIYHGDAIEVLKYIPNESIDLIFADTSPVTDNNSDTRPTVPKPLT